MEHFLAMGGYARFVWPAYGVAAVVLVGLLVESVIRYRRAQRELDAEERR
ncbi:MAG TPA: heme exporter protein CcmD [Stellaceae bacterium]|nr:heme exporter protein CcmD [Stellaceae bacterium]